MKTRAMAASGSLFALVAALAMPAHAAAKYKIHWLIGHQNLDYFEDAALDFKRTVETKSHGDIEVIIEKTGDSGGTAKQSASEVGVAVAKGEAEMGHSFTDIMGAVDPRLYAFEAPYLIRDYRHMEGVIEGPIGAELLDGLRPKGIVGLSFTYSGGANGIASVDREIRKPEDLKGLKVGVYGDEVNASWLRALGATPVAIGHAEETILSKEKDGSLDAAVITWRNFERASLDSRFKRVSLMNSTYLVSVTYINEKFFDSLPKEYQTLLRQTSHIEGRIERAKTIELNELTRRKVMAYGVHPVALTEAGRARFVRAVQPAYASIEALVGKSLLESIKTTKDGPMPSGDLRMYVDVVGR
jgi:TRAP-type C4-dicarboxylate transport system substrate-binding protein